MNKIKIQAKSRVKTFHFLKVRIIFENVGEKCKSLSNKTKV